ncbi:MAG: ABC transporter permease [Alphaproteobacteria bacterium]|nr:ABC transporter permease [Alphaproteobacteria bacterium]
MSRVLAVAARDLRVQLRTPAGWLALAAIQALAGLFWLMLVDGYVERRADLVFDPYAAARTTLADHLVAPYLGNVAVLLLVLGPAVTMGALAEERRTGRSELLLTSPLRPAELVAGKALASLGWVALVLAGTAVLPLALGAWAPVDLGALAGGYLGLGLLGAVVVGVGLLCSAVTDRQVVALLLAYVVLMALWVVGWLDRDPTSLPSQLSLSAHLRDLLRGAVRRSDLSYLLLLTGWTLFATWQRVRTWRHA